MRHSKFIGLFLTAPAILIGCKKEVVREVPVTKEVVVKEQVEVEVIKEVPVLKEEVVEKEIIKYKKDHLDSKGRPLSVSFLNKLLDSKPYTILSYNRDYISSRYETDYRNYIRKQKIDLNRKYKDIPEEFIDDFNIAYNKEVQNLFGDDLREFEKLENKEEDIISWRGELSISSKSCESFERKITDQTLFNQEELKPKCDTPAREQVDYLAWRRLTQRDKDNNKQIEALIFTQTDSANQVDTAVSYELEGTHKFSRCTKDFCLPFTLIKNNDKYTSNNFDLNSNPYRAGDYLKISGGDLGQEPVFLGSQDFTILSRHLHDYELSYFLKRDHQNFKPNDQVEHSVRYIVMERLRDIELKTEPEQKKENSYESPLSTGVYKFDLEYSKKSEAPTFQGNKEIAQLLDYLPRELFRIRENPNSAIKINEIYSKIFDIIDESEDRKYLSIQLFKYFNDVFNFDLNTSLAFKNMALYYYNK
ncbi:hypothetical protein HBN50_05580 [Halobacteriovorax sp. GB3]|uniref:hypothetical protein n=1 Tax=Halobacteriovorax sp. GB3 TaxID=2719615 RepID=UPI0023614319|nr:hypothetical protein [Halobacteriovorax sp. GB3]MDD0852558.1 hypothetical protein [Halobacteriovorax sp. GB3]